MYFDFKTINELINNNYNDNRQEKEFTVEELGQYSGENGMPAYVAIEGLVYDVSKLPAWQTGKHFGLTAGQDLSEEFDNCHGIMDILTNAPKVGVLAENEHMNDDYMNNGINMSMNRLIRQQDTSKFTPDDWIRYTVPLVVYALREPTQGMNLQRIYQKIILMGVLVGLGRTPQQAINQVQEWQSSGTAKLLQGTTTVGGGTTGTSGGVGTGGTTGGTTGTSGGVGMGGTAGGTTGTSGGFGTGGTAGGTTGTSGGFGMGGTAGGTTTGGGFGTGGTAGGTTGTSGGFGTGGTAGGTTGTSGGFGTGGTAGGTTGTGGGFGTGGTTGGTTGTGGGFGTGGTTSGTTGTGVGTGTGGTTGTGGSTVRNRLNID